MAENYDTILFMQEISYTDAHLLVKWFDENKRDLPWRETYAPYDVLVSEIMLQQTRVEAVIPKYISFMHALPSFNALSDCEDDILMKLWEGLGYYSRARNLKKCATVVIDQYQGDLPTTRKELESLPGIGPYTAGAILAISFGVPTHAIDGNVLRVLARFFGISKSIHDPSLKSDIQRIIENFYTNDIVSKEFVRSFTQGLMELGALVCLPNGKPLCSTCPFQKNCYAYMHALIDLIPTKSKPIKRKIVKKTVFIIHDESHYLIHKRDNEGLLANLYEFPSIDEWIKKENINEYIPSEIVKVKKLTNTKHVFTHLEWHMHAYEIIVKDLSLEQYSEQYYLYNKKELHDIAIPSAFKIYKELFL